MPLQVDEAVVTSVPWDEELLGLERVVGDLAPRPRTVAIGVFDGVHRGHQKLLARIRRGAAPTVVTFDPHPRAFFGQEVPLLTTIDRLVELLRDHGAVEVAVLRFDRRLAEMPAERWAQVLLGSIGTEQVVVGEDFRFGQGRMGDAALLRRLGFAVMSVPLVDDLGSTRVRSHLELGEIEAATRALGRRPEVELAVRGYVCTPLERSVTCVPAENRLQLPPAGTYIGGLQGTVVRLEVDRDPTGPQIRLTSHAALDGVDFAAPLRVSLVTRLCR